MINRYDDPNWGPHGNPAKHTQPTPRERRELGPLFSMIDTDSDADLFENQPKVGIWSVIMFVIAVMFLSGISETVRYFIYEGGDLAQIWYSGVDSMLDTLGAPKLP